MTPQDAHIPRRFKRRNRQTGGHDVPERLKILIVEDDESARESIGKVFGRAGSLRFDVEFISTEEVWRPFPRPLACDVVMVDIASNPQASLEAASRLRSTLPMAGIAIMAPSDDFMAPVEIINMGLGPLVILDYEGMSSLPSVAMSLAGDGGGSQSSMRGDLSEKNRELRDITDSLARQSVHLIRLRNELAAEKSKLETIINGMSDGVIFFNVDGALEMINPVARKIITSAGYKDEPELESFLRFIREHETSGANTAADAGDTFESSMGPKTYRTRIGKVFDSEDEMAGLLIMLTDITQDKEYEKLKNEFTSMISHELRTPLTSIRAAVDNLLRGNLGDVTDDQTKFLRLIARNVDRQQDLIDNLLDLARLEAGQMEMSMERGQMTTPAVFCMDHFSLAFKDKGVNLTGNFDEDTPRIYMDQGLITQAINNLLSNALKFTEAGGEVSISVKKEMVGGSPYVGVIVADTGVGIAREHLEKVFDKYTQADSSIRRRFAGTGLGLAICKEIARAHNGLITVDSEPGRGSRFSLLIPVMDELGE